MVVLGLRVMSFQEELFITQGSFVERFMKAVRNNYLFRSEIDYSDRTEFTK